MTKEELKQKLFYVISLGCDKNRVDSERIIYSISNYGLKYTDDINSANIVIINTCAFIKSAKEESIDNILNVAELKQQNLEKLIVCGCFAQRYYEEAKQGFPEVDAVVRLTNNKNIVDIIKGLYGVDEVDKYGRIPALNRVVSTPKHYAYLKIADGCNNCCAYCTIPQIRGRFTSVEPQSLICEAKELVKSGVKELILVAQDVTSYGKDLFGKPMLVELIKELSKIKNLKWIRLHYCYPHLIDDKLLKEIETNPKVCKYLDIPMQHSSNSVLKAMNRKDTLENNTQLLEKIHNLSCFVAVRSTFIVGFPGETKEDVKILKDFLTSQKMQYVGFFKYSREEHTRAYNMPHQVPERTKDNRLYEIQTLQQNIMFESQERFIGKTMLSVLEKIEDDGTYVLRNQYNSPNIDTVIYATSNKKLKIGEFYNVKITGLEGIDLKGEVL